MVARKVGEAVEAMHGSLVAGSGERIFRGAALDSRAVQGEEIFFALAGERTDGHRFVGDAVGRGAAAAVVSRPVELPEGPSLIRVEDTYRALHDLTRHVRRQVPEHLVGLTGSAGKTTTKSLLTRMLARRYRVAASPGNLNNTYGFPIALLGIPDDTEWMVAEMGMSTPGELGCVSRLGRPDVALFLNVRAAHLEAFGAGAEAEVELRRIGDAKAELLDGLSEEGLIVANATDPMVIEIARRGLAEPRTDRRVIWYALRRSLPAVERCDLLAEAIRFAPGLSRFDLAVPGGDRVEVRLPLHGEVNVENFLAAAACAHALGLSLEEIAASAAEAGAEAGRGKLVRLSGAGFLVDDSYNSNPDALSRALEAAARLPGERRWVVAGAMLELGESSPRYHFEAGREAAGLGFSPVLGVGSEARPLVEGARSGGAETHWAEDAEAAAVWATEQVRPGDVVLVKGSRGIGLERVVEELVERFGEVDA